MSLDHSSTYASVIPASQTFKTGTVEKTADSNYFSGQNLICQYDESTNFLSIIIIKKKGWIYK